MLQSLRRRGFTLTELLIVIGVIGVLSGIVITAVNPSHQLVVANDAKRKAAVRTLQDAVYQYVIDDNPLPAGLEPVEVDSPAQPICHPAGNHQNCVNLDVLIDQGYIAAMPVDAVVIAEAGGGTPNVTGFTISISVGGQVTAKATHTGTVGSSGGQQSSGQSSSEGSAVLMVYWTDKANGTIQRRAADGSGSVEDVYTNLDMPGDIVFDPDNGDLYWTSDDGFIYRGNVDQSAYGPFIEDSVNDPWRLALDTASDTIYWSIKGGNEPIRKSSTLLPNEQTGVTVSSGNAEHIAFALASPSVLSQSQIYWTITSGTILRKNADDSDSSEIVIPSGQSKPYPLDLDPLSDTLCWGFGFNAFPPPVLTPHYSIRCADMDGFGAQTIVSDAVRDIRDVALDMAVGRIYWVDVRNKTVQSALIAGGPDNGLVTIASGTIDGLQAPEGLTLVRVNE